MTCSRCSNARAVWLDDDTTALGGLTVPCGRCCCKDCGSLLDAPWGYCAFGCRIREEYRTAGAWVEAAARMHFGAGTSQSVALANSYRRRREYCTRKARALGEHVGLALKGAAQRVELLAAFAHVFEASAVLQ